MHPDVLFAGRGCSDEEREEAEARIRELNEAYEAVRKLL